MKRRIEVLTQERMREVLSYDPETGIWTWIKRPSKQSRKRPGDVAGNRGARYIQISIDGENYYAHRLVWFWMMGEWPQPSCDHKDTNGFNNRWSNIRLATYSQNSANCGLYDNNTSGWKGVTWATHLNKWQARVRSKSFGVYDCGAAAYFAYLVGADKTFGEFARGG